MIRLKAICFCFCLLFAAQSNAEAQSQLEQALLKPYIFFTYTKDSPEDHNYGAFHYTNVHHTLPEDMVGPYYQSGLFHTWYRPVKIYGQKDYSRDKYGYHAMEGGVGYKPYLRFRTDGVPFKFTTGAVAGGFGSFSNGPGQGSPSFKRTQKSPTLGWEKNVGRYGAAHLSNRLLYPLDGVGLESGTNNQMLGYGYYALPLTEPKATTADQPVPSGNHCWTLFFQTKNFSGPVCFFTPYHWSKYTIKRPELAGMCFDNSLLKLNSTYQRETNVVPVKKWVAPNGDSYYRATPFTMAADKDMIGRYGSMPMTIDGTKWKQLSSWFAGKSKRKSVDANFGRIGKEIHVRRFEKGNLAFQIDKIRIKTNKFSRFVNDKDASAGAFQWGGDLVKRYDKDLVQIPEYYMLKKGAKQIDAIPAEAVPAASKLTKVRFPEDVEKKFNKKDFKFSDSDSPPIMTPLHPDYRHRNEIVQVWQKPGPSNGPYVAKLSDGSQLVYYWYKFNEQPAILNSYMDKAERELMQKRVELIHEHWSIDERCFPDPAQPLASLDEALIVKPPRGLEVGYVPVCVHQQKAGEKLPKFKEISKRR